MNIRTRLIKNKNLTKINLIIFLFKQIKQNDSNLLRIIINFLKHFILSCLIFKTCTALKYNQRTFLNVK